MRFSTGLEKGSTRNEFAGGQGFSEALKNEPRNENAESGRNQVMERDEQ